MRYQLQWCTETRGFVIEIAFGLADNGGTELWCEKKKNNCILAFCGVDPAADEDGEACQSKLYFDIPHLVYCRSKIAGLQKNACEQKVFAWVCGISV